MNKEGTRTIAMLYYQKNLKMINMKITIWEMVTQKIVSH
jgi:uncharacterized membrane protein